MDKQIVAYPYNGMLLSVKRNKLPIHMATWMSSKTSR